MKIYLSATKNYETISSLIEKEKHVVVDNIRKANMAIFEVSEVEGFKARLRSALGVCKPVAMLIPSDNKEVINTIEDYELKWEGYCSASLDKALKKLIDDLKKEMDIRFNFFVSPEIVNYLGWVAQKKKVSRSVFLRSLIEREMKKDKGFRQ